MRNLICADTNTMKPLHYHLDDDFDLRGNPENFHRNVPRVRANVYCTGSRLELIATVGYALDRDRIMDISSRFPLNKLARELFDDDLTETRHDLDCDDGLYGDAYLISDIRERWVIPCPRMSIQEIEDFSDSMISPNQPGYAADGSPWKIVFDGSIQPVDQVLIGSKFLGADFS